MYLWFSDDEYQRLLANGAKTQGDGEGNNVPVVKLFTPDANCTWLLTEIVPPEAGEEPELAFGLCDLGLGFPELGYVSLTELKELRGNARLPVEKDLHFEGSHPILDYAEAARAEGQIVEEVA